jgi:hypothetical protein
MTTHIDAAITRAARNVFLGYHVGHAATSRHGIDGQTVYPYPLVREIAAERKRTVFRKFLGSF